MCSMLSILALPHLSLPVQTPSSLHPSLGDLPCPLCGFLSSITWPSPGCLYTFTAPLWNPRAAPCASPTHRSCRRSWDSRLLKLSHTNKLLFLLPATADTRTDFPLETAGSRMVSAIPMFVLVLIKDPAGDSLIQGLRTWARHSWNPPPGGARTSQSLMGVLDHSSTLDGPDTLRKETLD